MGRSQRRKEAERQRKDHRAAQRAAWMFAALIRTPDKIEAAPLDPEARPQHHFDGEIIPVSILCGKKEISSSGRILS